ncbi:MAG: amidohydrolase [Oscillospiraceae bacterium]|nr:amidohydrolase [Oscillospiraceae bacterium]
MLRFYGGKILCGGANADITEGEVWVDGDRISYVGPAKEGPLPSFEREINLKGNLLMPGFKNGHTHSAMTFCRSLADGMPLQDWLFNLIFPLESYLTPEIVYNFSKIALLEYLQAGITANFDMYYHRDAIANASLDYGFRTVICGTNGSVETMEREYEHFNSINPLITMLPSIHAEYTAAPEDWDAIASVIKNHKMPFFTHSSETASEVQGCIERHGMTPTEWFDSLGLYDYGGGGYHCVYMSDRDFAIYKEKGLWMITNPRSNAKLASGIAPLERAIKEGINLAIGTDGPSSNNALSMFGELYAASTLQKLATMDAAAGDAEALILAACTGGARAMNLPDCDSIAVGKKADLIVIDASLPNMQPCGPTVANLVYAGNDRNVKMTMIDGKVLYENGEYTFSEDIPALYETCRGLLEDMLSKYNENKKA